MSLHPDCYSDYRVAKRSAAVLATACGASLLQNAQGKPRVIFGQQPPRDFPTWLAALSWLHQIRQDQITRQQPSRSQTPPPIARRAPPEPAPSPMLDEPWKC